MIIKNALAFTDSCKFKEQDVFIEGERIAPETSDPSVLDGDGCYLIPGLIDIHFHGCMGYDFCDATPRSLETIAAYELQCGITSICPATMTLPQKDLIRVCQNAVSYRKHWQPGQGANLCGIHLEGPFIARSKKGAQNPDYILAPDDVWFERLLDAADGLVKLTTIAPEAQNAIEFIRKFSSQVRISIGHTDCDYDTAKIAFDNGAAHMTHLFNAMPPFTHRSPGPIGAAFDAKNVTPEIICDGIHVASPAVRLAFALFGEEHLIFISDSMMAAGMPDGSYSLGGLPVQVTDGRAVLTNGTIAGSTTNLMNCVKTAVQTMDIPLESAIRCATVNPAKAIGVEKDCGSIAIGKYADLLLLDRETLELKKVISHGVVL